MTSIERRVYGADAFRVEARAARTLLKFCLDHKSSEPGVSDVQACLTALEAGEKSNAIAAFKRVRMGKEGFTDWWPPAASPAESEEYAWGVFEALVERWCRLMKALGD
jgi:hypothetical protein